MSFFLTVGFYIVTLWLIVRYRRNLSVHFLKLPFSISGTSFIAAIIFSIIEEGVLNLASGTLFVLVATVPVLAIFVFVAGKLGRLFHAKRIRYPFIGLLTAGLLFEAFLGGHREGFQNPESVGTLVFGIVLTLITYAYVSLVSLTIMIEGEELRKPETS